MSNVVEGPWQKRQASGNSPEKISSSEAEKLGSLREFLVSIERERRAISEEDEEIDALAAGTVPGAIEEREQGVPSLNVEARTREIGAREDRLEKRRTALGRQVAAAHAFIASTFKRETPAYAAATALISLYEHQSGVDMSTMNPSDLVEASQEAVASLDENLDEHESFNVVEADPNALVRKLQEYGLTPVEVEE